MFVKQINLMFMTMLQLRSLPEVSRIEVEGFYSKCKPRIYRGTAFLIGHQLLVHYLQFFL